MILAVLWSFWTVNVMLGTLLAGPGELQGKAVCILGKVCRRAQRAPCFSLQVSRAAPRPRAHWEEAGFQRRLHGAAGVAGRRSEVQGAHDGEARVLAVAAAVVVGAGAGAAGRGRGRGWAGQRV